MIILTILALIAFLLIGFIVITVGTVGAAGIIVFGDVIVCIVLIFLLIKHIIKKKMRK